MVYMKRVEWSRGHGSLPWKRRKKRVGVRALEGNLTDCHARCPLKTYLLDFILEGPRLGSLDRNGGLAGGVGWGQSLRRSSSGQLLALVS